MPGKTEDRIVVHHAETRKGMGISASLFFMFENIRRSRELIWQLFKRDFLAAHRKSFLGMTWIFLGPVIGIASWVFMNATGVLKPGEVGMPYPAYVLLGTTFWGFFMSIYQMSSETLSAGSSFIMQVKFPHEALLAKQILQAVAGFLISFGVILIVLLFFEVTPNWKTIFLPLAVLPMILLGTALGLMMATIGAVVAEIRKAVDVILGILLFFTPILYARDAASGSYARLVHWNPLTHIVGGVRDLVAYGRMDDPAAYVWSSLGALVLFILSWRLFYVSEEKVVEKML